MSAVLNEPQPMTVAEAIGKAQWFRQQPEVCVDDKQAKRVIDTLLSALEVSPAYLAAIQNGEPVFVLRGQDVLAPIFVRRWAEQARQRGMAEEKVQEAMRRADHMEHWTPRKYPD